MGLDKKDLEMLSVSIPVVDWWDIQEEIDRLENLADRLESVEEALIDLYRTERVKSWEIILKKMLEKQEKKGNRNESAFRRR